MGGIANVFGAWTDLTAATATAIAITGFFFSAGANALEVMTEIAVGAAAAEVKIAAFAYRTPTLTNVEGWVYYPLATPISVAAGVRISARTKHDSGAKTTRVSYTWRNP